MTWRRRARRLGSALVTTTIVALVVFLWPARLGGSTNLVVVRGTSMEPVYHLNDIVITRTSHDYDIGDIVVFKIPDGVGEGMLVIHRLVGRRADGTWITEGDNRDTPDDFHVRDGDLLGKPVAVLPRAGRAVQFVSNVDVVAVALGLFGVLLLWPGRRAHSTVAPIRITVPDVDLEATAWLEAELAAIGLDPFDGLDHLDFVGEQSPLPRDR